MGSPAVVTPQWWRGLPGGEAEVLPAPVQPVGIPALDGALAQGGLPLGGVTEIRAAPGHGGMSLALRVCAEALRVPHARAVVVDGMGTLHGPGAVAAGIPPGVLWCVRPSEPAHAAAVALRLVRSRAFRVVVVDQVETAPAQAPELAVRRLSVAAQEASCAVLLLSGAWADGATLPLPAALRLRLSRQSHSQIVVFIEKQRGSHQSGHVGLSWPFLPAVGH